MEAQQTTLKNMQKCNSWKEQFESPTCFDRPKKAKFRQPSNDAESRPINRRAVCGGILPIRDSLLPLASDVTGKERNQETALMPNVGVVFTVGGPLVYGEGGRRSVSLNEIDFRQAFAA
jgi:hypothetical protein